MILLGAGWGGSWRLRVTVQPSQSETSRYAQSVQGGSLCRCDLPRNVGRLYEIRGFPTTLVGTHCHFHPSEKLLLRTTSRLVPVHATKLCMGLEGCGLLTSRLGRFNPPPPHESTPVPIGSQRGSIRFEEEKNLLSF